MTGQKPHFLGTIHGGNIKNYGINSTKHEKLDGGNGFPRAKMGEMVLNNAAMLIFR